MNQKSQTYGSIETSDAEKRRLAKESLSFNLKNKQFIELFPEIVSEMQDKLSKMKNEKEEPAVDNLIDTSKINYKKILQSILLNLMLIVAFVVIMFSIKYIV